MVDDPYTRNAVEIIAAAGSNSVPESRRFAPPLLDAYSVAAGSLGQEVIAPDPRVERDLGEAAAIATASGMMSVPLDVQGRWWQGLPGPVVAGSPRGAVTLLPQSLGAVRVESPTRKRTRFRSRTTLPDDAFVLSGSVPADRSWFKLLLWSVRRRATILILLLGAGVAGSLSGLVLPLATGVLFGAAVPAGDLAAVSAILTVLALATVGGALMFVVRDVLILRLRDISDSCLSTGIVAHLLKLPANYFTRMSAGEILNRTLSVHTARELVDDGVPSAILAAAFSAVNLIFLLAIDLSLGLFTTTAVVAFGAIVVAIQLRSRASLREMLQQQSTSDGLFMSLTNGIVPIRVSGAESRAFAQWAQSQGRALTAYGRAMREIDGAQSLLAGSPILMLFVLTFGVVHFADARLSLGAFVAAYLAVAQLTAAMALLPRNLARLSDIGPIVARSLPVTTAPSERSDKSRHPGPLRGGVTLTDVVFGYDPQRPPLLNGLNIEIRSGEFVALVGPSGSGKSTVLRLMLGFEQPWRGTVTYDGQGLAELDMAAVRRQVGTVLQDCRPFGRTYRECICGPRQIPDMRLWTVLKEVELSDEARKHGLDTPFGEGATELSGGQRQRLMIARALAGEPHVILLDEATSALDDITQGVVMKSILTKPVTRVAIAHRLSTVKRADRILVMSDGKIIESGPPAELLRRTGYFSEMIKRQEF